MFTGIVKAHGRIGRRAPVEGGLRLAVAVEPPLAALEAGESIAVNGVCLTAEAESGPGNLLFFLSDETLARSALGGLAEGDAVNLERALRAEDRLGGHLVLGHVDAVGEIRRWERTGEAWELEVAFPPAMAPYLASKGSVAVDGISLTVVAVHADAFTAAIVPHTVGATNLSAAAPGRCVNLEADVLARYVVRALEAFGCLPSNAGNAGAAEEAFPPRF